MKLSVKSKKRAREDECLFDINRISELPVATIRNLFQDLKIDLHPPNAKKKELIILIPKHRHLIQEYFSEENQHKLPGKLEEQLEKFECQKRKKCAIQNHRKLQQELKFTLVDKEEKIIFPNLEFNFYQNIHKTGTTILFTITFEKKGISKNLEQPKKANSWSFTGSIQTEPDFGWNQHKIILLENTKECTWQFYLPALFDQALTFQQDGKLFGDSDIMWYVRARQVKKRCRICLDIWIPSVLVQMIVMYLFLE